MISRTFSVSYDNFIVAAIKNYWIKYSVFTSKNYSRAKANRCPTYCTDYGSPIIAIAFIRKRNNNFIVACIKCCSGVITVIIFKSNFATKTYRSAAYSSDNSISDSRSTSFISVAYNNFIIAAVKSYTYAFKISTIVYYWSTKAY